MGQASQVMHAVPHGTRKGKSLMRIFKSYCVGPRHVRHTDARFLRISRPDIALFYIDHEIVCCEAPVTSPATGLAPLPTPSSGPAGFPSFSAETISRTRSWVRPRFRNANAAAAHNRPPADAAYANSAVPTPPYLTASNAKPLAVIRVKLNRLARATRIRLR